MSLYRPFPTPPTSLSAVDGQPLPSVPNVANGPDGSSGATPTGGAATPRAGYAVPPEGSTAAYPASPDPAPTTSPLIMALGLSIRRSPAATAARIVRLLSNATTADRLLRVDLHVLLAEVLHQAGDLTTALEASGMAAQTAGALTPLDWPRMVTTLLVGADLAVSVRHPGMVDACLGVISALTYLPAPDHDRAVVAAGLHAVALHHHGVPGQGLRLLEHLRETAAPGPREQLLTAALTAMRPAGAGQPQHGTPPPVPGGLLQPRLDATTVGYLAHRIGTQVPPDQAAIK